MECKKPHPMQLILFLLMAGVSLQSCSVKKLPPTPGHPKWGLEVTWHGHSCFTLKDSVDRKIVIDPYDETVGYGKLELLADALLVTHNHFDHNYRRAVKANHREIDLASSTGTVTVAGDMQVTGLPAVHDTEGGQINGDNTIYIFVMGGLRCVHLGDLGDSRLTDYQMKMIGKVDVLFIPVGGKVTLNAEEARAVVEALKPAVIFPMHYGGLRFYPLDPLEKFTALFPPEQVKIVSENRVRVREEDLPIQPTVFVLKPVSKK